MSVRLEELLELPRSERARLAHALLRSLDDEEQYPDADALWAAEIVRRIEEGEKHPERFVPWELV